MTILIGLIVAAFIGVRNALALHYDVNLAVRMIASRGGSIDDDYTPLHGPTRVYFGAMVPGEVCPQCELFDDSDVIEVSKVTLCFTRLRELSVRNCNNVSSSSVLQFISEHPRIQVLKLAGTSVDDSLLMGIGDDSQITEMHLQDTNITPSGVLAITRLPHLQRVVVSHGRMSEGELEWIRSHNITITETSYSEAAWSRGSRGGPG